MYLPCVIGFLCLLQHVSCVYGYESKPCVNITDSKPVCTCSGYTTDCSGRNLTFIPEIPAETQILNMSGNSLTHIKNTSFTNISRVSLTSLDLSKNKIMKIYSESFSSLTNLRILNLSLNQFHYKTASNITNKISRSLNTLTLEGLRFEIFPQKLVHSLRRTQISKLSFKNNSLKIVKSAKYLSKLTHLRELDLSFNYIHTIEVPYLEKLEYFSLSSNDFSEFPTFCEKNGSALLPSLMAIFLDDNCIRKLHMERINCLDKLILFNISATKIEQIPKNAFNKLKSLSILTIEKSESLTYIDEYAFNSSTLRKVYIRANHMSFEHQNVRTETFLRDCPGLENLDLSSNILSMLNQSEWDDIFRHLPNLTYLDIGYSKLLYLPNPISKYLLNLKTLHVASAEIAKIPLGFFERLHKLEKLLMSDNKLTTISAVDLPPNFVNHMNYIDFAYNPFHCDCKLLWFVKFTVQFTEHNKKIMAHFPEKYTCALKKWTRITDAHIDEKLCMLNRFTSQLIIFTCFAFIISLLTLSLIYRYRWRIRYMIFILNFHRRQCSIVNEIRHLHDIYISSSDGDFNVVYNHIVLGLEAKGFSVHFPERDAMPGTLKIWESLEHIDRSKYVILCLSNAYAQDNWCEFEACMAIERSISAGNDDSIVIVIVLDEIEALNMTKVTNKLLTPGDYLMWDNTFETNDLFWRKLEHWLCN